jgi:hypothetical protein
MRGSCAWNARAAGGDDLRFWIVCPWRPRLRPLASGLPPVEFAPERALFVGPPLETCSHEPVEQFLEWQSFKRVGIHAYHHAA